jgi:hypothetical protein
MPFKMIKISRIDSYPGLSLIPGPTSEEKGGRAVSRESNPLADMRS